MATFGAYKSVNTLVHFADALAEHGPYDPAERVTIQRSRDGRYTIDGFDAFDSDGKPKTGLELRYFYNNAIRGVTYVSNGQMYVEADGLRYVVYISDAGGKVLPYSISVTYKNDPNMYLVERFDLPSDHPFLQAYNSQ